MTDSLHDTEARLSEVFSREIFFIVGAPKSGTTWVQITLDGHPEIRCAGEGHFTDWFGAPLKALLGEYNDKLAFNNDFVYHGKGYYPGYTQGDFRYLVRTAIGLAWARLDLPPEMRLLGEKTPIYTYHLDFVELLFPDAKVLHVVRDGRDAAASAMAQKLRLGDDPSVVPGSEPWYAFLEKFARKWAEVTQSCRVFGATRPERYHEVRYEDLLTDPHTHLGAALRFLGAADTAEAIDACVANGSFETLSGGRKRGDEDPASFFRKGVAGDWRTSFDERGLQILLDHQGPMLRQFDYPS